MALIKRTVLEGRVYAASDADSPNAGTLAVAVRFADGWTVARTRGRVVGNGLTQRQALALMLRTARAVVDRAAAQRVAASAAVEVAR
jgi:hypothetical protein